MLVISSSRCRAKRSLQSVYLGEHADRSDLLPVGISKRRCDGTATHREISGLYLAIPSNEALQLWDLRRHKFRQVNFQTMSETCAQLKSEQTNEQLESMGQTLKGSMILAWRSA
eukprot:COSAG02_NODE_1793_length_10918_cov_41.286533_9_plen_114_part_00